MPKTNKPASEEKVACEVCLKEIPKSEAKSAEVNDYVLHFCGLECYAKWQKPTDKKKNG